ncbi:hypothetical protein [Kribbella catacumbae]|uniref:hypothetical protein n=1 Tax=Kribbella catacumbae TaxID=460086 RepID=UPI000364905A|nr:hypothetical protein [Kribbella catacumbae]
MNIQLDPPPVPPLSPSKRSRLRNRVMDQARPTTGRSVWRWAAPVIAIGGVAAVVAGTLVVTDKPTADPGVAGTPAPSGVSPASGAPKVDRGAVPAALLPKLQGDCQWPNETENPNLLWTRHVRGITGDSTTAVAVASQPKKSDPPPVTRNATGERARRGSSPGSSAYNLGVRLCLTRTPSAGLGSIGSTVVVANKVWTARPTAAQGLVALDTSGFEMTKNNGTLQLWTLYRARPEIARVEARSVWKGKFGEWTEGVVDGGFAYTEVQTRGKFVNGDHLKQQVRAFDAAGNPVPVKL